MVRQHRGEGVTRTQPVSKVSRTQANAWLTQLADIRKKEVAAEKAAAAVKAKTLLKTAKAASSTATDAASTTTAEADSTATVDAASTATAAAAAASSNEPPLAGPSASEP